MRKLIGREGARGAGPTAFVLYLGFPGLGAVRSLGRAGAPVIGLDSNSDRVGFASRYGTAKRCPHPIHEPDRLLDFLRHEGSQLAEPGILSPASDAFVLFLSRYRDELREHFRFNLPSPEVVEASVNKRQLYTFAEDLGIPLATTHYPETLDDVHRIKADLDYPVYIKPYYSHLWRAQFPGLSKGIKAYTPRELVTGFERIVPTGLQAMVQSIILGPASNVRTVRVYVTVGGEMLAVFTTRTVRQYPVEFGVGTMLESFHDPEVRELGTRFFRDLNYRGVGTIEFKRDDRDGRLKVTDLNPRWWGSINLAPDSGVDFPLIHYLDLTGQTPAPQLTFKEGVRWLDGLGDLASAWLLMRAGELSPWAWARSWAGARSFATFALDDPKPFLKQYQYGLRVVREPLYLWRHRRTLAEEATPPAVGVRPTSGR